MVGVAPIETERMITLRDRLMRDKGLSQEQAQDAAAERHHLRVCLRSKLAHPGAWKDWVWDGKYWDENEKWLARESPDQPS